jgi:predicted GNAT superfamily acetyltransferase
VIRVAVPGDFESICALNLAEVRHTSPMDLLRLTELHGLACYHKVACVEGGIAAFLLAVCHGAAYENENYQWFARRHERFVYVDRVVVSSGFRGRGLGAQLYEDLFRHAREHGIPRVTCEYNLVPPNEASRAFHDKFGFQEQGTQWLANGSKQVSLQSAMI